MARIVIVAHKYLPQPDDDLVAYLNGRRTETVLHIYHSFPDATDRRSFFQLYQTGELKQQGQTKDYRAWPEPLIYLKELFFTLYWTVRLGGRWDQYIGMDGLCVLFGNLLRLSRRVRRTTFWAIDFVPSDRFKSRFKNIVYARINRHSCLSTDEMWDLSPRMAHARERYHHIPRNLYRNHKVVPYGLWLARLRHRSYDDCEKRAIVFMGHLLEKQGVQLVLQAMPRVLEQVPDARFKIIGDGSYRSELQRLARHYGVEECCDFLGKIPSLQGVEEEIAKSAVAVAPYVRALDTWTAYADPGKVKTYLACGVPVLLTDVPWNADEIVKHGCGLIVSEDPLDIAESLINLLRPEVNRRMREACLRYARGFDWASIFDSAVQAPRPTEAGAMA